MYPIDHYATLLRGREELLRQAEQERMARAAKFKNRTKWTFHRKTANWLRMHLVSWGKKLEQFVTLGKRQHTTSTSTHA